MPEMNLGCVLRVPVSLKNELTREVWASRVSLVLFGRTELQMTAAARVECIAQTVAHQVDAQNGKDDEYAGEDPHPS